MNLNEDTLAMVLDDHTPTFDRAGEWTGCWCDDYSGTLADHPRHQADMVIVAFVGQMVFR